MQSGSDLNKQLLEQLNLAIILLTSDGQVKFANQQAAFLFELSPRKLNDRDFFSIPIKHTLNITLLERVWKTEQGFSEYEVEWTFVDGRQLITDVKADLVVIDNEKFCALQIRHEDHLRKFDLEQKQKHQISASRHLIRSLAHEIKNPLGGIRGAAQLLSRSLDSSELQEYTTMIIEQSDRLRDLVDRLLGPNKLPQRAPTNIHTIINRVINLCNASLSDGVRIRADFDPSLPELLVDADQIEQAILNLVTNAIYAAKQSESVPEVIVQSRFVGNKIMHEKQFKQVIKITISDNGPGIDEKIKETLFYPMVTSKSDGSGLGLPISQTLVDQHSGQIEYASRQGLTQFSIFLPKLTAGNTDE